MLKEIICLFMLLSQNPAENINLIKKLAHEAYPNNINMANIMASQAILESRLFAQPSLLALKHCNLFGMKPGKSINQKGTNGIINLGTTECKGKTCYKENAYFLSNHNIEDSIQQYKTLMSKPFYAKVKGSQSLEEGAHALVKAGYATDPNYASELIDIYNKYVK